MGLRTTKDRKYNAEDAWNGFPVDIINHMSEALLKKIKAESLKYYREGGKEGLQICGEEAGAEEGIVFVTDMTEREGTVRIYGLVGSPLYIALYLHRYEEAEQILESAPGAAEPGYAGQQFRVSFSAGEPEKCEIKFRVGCGIYLEEILLTDPDLPDGLLIRLWNIFFQRKQEDHPSRLGEVDGEERFPLLIRGWPYSVHERLRSGDLKGRGAPWCDERHSREEYGPFLKAVREGLAQFWRGLKGLYRLKTLAPDLYAAHADERFAAHLILEFMRIIQHVSAMEYQIWLDKPEEPSSDGLGTWEELLRAAQNLGGMTPADEKPRGIKILHLAVDGAEALRKLKKGFQKLGFTYFSGDILWDACMELEYLRDTQHRSEVLCLAFEIWKEIFGEELFITMDGLRKERSERLMSILLYEFLDSEKQADARNTQYMTLVYYLDGLRWAENEGSEWLKQKRENAGRRFLKKNDREVLLHAMEKNILLPEDADFLWENCSKEEYIQLKPLLLMKKYGCL